MKSLHESDSPHRIRQHGVDAQARPARRLPWLPAVLALSVPLLESTALAQGSEQQSLPQVPKEAPANPGPQPLASPVPTFQVSGSGVKLTEGKYTRRTFVVAKQANEFPVVELEGPSTLTIRFYPIIKAERFTATDTDVSWQIEYALSDGAGATTSQSFNGTTRRSNFTTSDVELDKAFVIGTPITLTIQVPKGYHRFSVLEPNGFLEVWNVEPIEEAPTPPPRHVIPMKPAEPIKIAAPSPEPAKRSDIKLEGGYLGLQDMGPDRNSGNIAETGLVFERKGPTFGFKAGLMLNSIGMHLDMPHVGASLRVTSLDAMAGLSVQGGKHSLYAGPFAGPRFVALSVTPDATLEASAGIPVLHQLEAGGLIGYDYDNLAALSVRMSNNPLNPLTARASLSSPWGWVHDNPPELSLAFRMMHLVRPEAAPLAGAFSVAGSDYLAQAGLKVPIMKLGPVVPSALMAIQESMSAAGTAPLQVYLGGILKARFGADSFLEVGAASTTGGKPLFLLRAAFE